MDTVCARVIKQSVMRALHLAPAAAVVCLIAACGPNVNAQDAASLKADIAAVQKEISSAEAENAKYAGGLVKSLIVTRIAVLRQTEAMLQQRSKASTFGISLKYTIDGSPFAPPASANDLLRSVEQEISDSQAKIARQEAEAADQSHYPLALVLTVGQKRSWDAARSQSKSRSDVEFLMELLEPWQATR